LNSADKIKTPLLVIQGANDPRVNKAEAEQIVIALRDRGFPIEYILAPDEGHGFARPVNNLAMFMAAERFLAKHLDGLFQDGGSAESVTRLKEITVDPKTVVLSKKLDAAAVGVPKPSADLQPGSFKARVVLAAGPQQINLSIESSVKEENGAWVVTETTETPAGPATDIGVLEKGTLIMRKRTIQQGPTTISFEIAGDRATGKINAGGREIPLSAEIKTPLFANGPGSSLSIAALPLAEGYSTTFSNFDFQRQRVLAMQLKVLGSETVTVPAGTFDTFKVEYAADDGSNKTTLWIAKNPRKPIKGQAVQGNGSLLTIELVP
jgi:hypothetical protein